MMQEKQTYHVDLVSGDVLGQKLEENPSFTVHATDEELAELKQCLEEHRTDDLEAYARSHVPYLLYHHDRANDKYDAAMKSFMPSFINLAMKRRETILKKSAF